ncbi:START-like domain-containing protein [Fulvivirgaceae bacterium BMA10]|uniref:START-like domain-containing protein n=1 Tax=Splendidivirga corallicola TaxID=3051826 RepID=A0ABT8KVU0_9BACT|nr:START-like domain-containing protein [Fulvivirgaceae bacterium BMA10]
MGKNKFTTEFEINASKKMLFPYLYTASGLAQWFADDVNVNEDKVFNFIWDGEDHKAKMTAHRTNSYVKFEFLPSRDDEDDDHSFFEFKLDKNELTQSVFLRITDYSDMDDEDELQDMWENLVLTLRETVGG